MTPKQKAENLLAVAELTILTKVGGKISITEIKMVSKELICNQIFEIEDTLLNNGMSNKLDYWKNVRYEIQNFK